MLGMGYIPPAGGSGVLTYNSLLSYVYHQYMVWGV